MTESSGASSTGKLRGERPSVTGRTNQPYIGISTQTPDPSRQTQPQRIRRALANGHFVELTIVSNLTFNFAKKTPVD